MEEINSLFVIFMGIFVIVTGITLDRNLEKKKEGKLKKRSLFYGFGSFLLPVMGLPVFLPDGIVTFSPLFLCAGVNGLINYFFAHK